MTTETKINKLREWLLSGKPITQREAIEKWNYYRLAAGIGRLRHEFNLPIKTTIGHNPDSTYAIYQLITHEDERNN